MQLNIVVIGGNLTRDIELKYTPSGNAVARLGVAVNRRFKTKEGDFKDEVSFIDVTVWGKGAENCSQYLKKGSPCVVRGRLKQEQWEVEGQKKSKIEVIPDNEQFVGAKRQADEGDAPSGSEG